MNTSKKYTPRKLELGGRRLIEPVGNVPPAEYGMIYYEQLEESSEAPDMITALGTRLLLPKY